MLRKFTVLAAIGGCLCTGAASAADATLTADPAPMQERAASPASPASVPYVIEGVVTLLYPPKGIKVRVTEANANARAGLRGKRQIDVRFDRSGTRIVDRNGRRIRATAIQRGHRVYVRWYSHSGAIIEYMRFAALVRDLSLPAAAT